MNTKTSPKLREFDASVAPDWVMSRGVLGGVQGRRGFTLLELLMVIAVMAIIAGLLVGLAPVASVRMKESRTRAELARLVSAIESYKARHGVYPPDHIVRYEQGYPVVDPLINPLFYELTGVLVVNTPQNGYFVPLGDADGTGKRLTPEDVSRFFGPNRDGFVNAATEENQRRLYRVSFKEKQVERISEPNDVDIKVLVAPVPWPLNDSRFPPLINVPGKESINPWRYVSTNPTNNPAQFDLWCEVIIGGKRKVIGNWGE